MNRVVLNQCHLKFRPNLRRSLFFVRWIDVEWPISICSGRYDTVDEESHRMICLTIMTDINTEQPPKFRLRSYSSAHLRCKTLVLESKLTFLLDYQLNSIIGVIIANRSRYPVADFRASVKPVDRAGRVTAVSIWSFCKGCTLVYIKETEEKHVLRL